MNAPLQKKTRIPSSLATSSATQAQQLLQTVGQLNRLTAVLETQAKYDEALAQAQTALENLTNAKIHLSSTTTVTLELQVLANLGRLQRILGNYAQGQQLFLRAIHLAQTEAADKQILIPLSNELAMLYKYWGHFEAAEPIYQNLLTTLLARYGANHLAVAKVYHNLAGLEHARRCYDKAEPLARQSYQLHRQLLGKQHPDTIADGAALGAILHGLKQWDEAINLFEQSIAWLEQQSDSNRDLVAVNLNNLAASLQAKGELRQAERAYRQALSIQESLWKQEHPELAITLNNLAILLKQQGQLEEAPSLFKRALTIFDKTLGVNHPHTILCQQNAIGGLTVNMIQFQEINGITYELLQEKDLEQTINCLVDVFTSAEPITTAIKMTASEFYPLAEIVCQKAVKDGFINSDRQPAKTAKDYPQLATDDLREDINKCVEIAQKNGLETLVLDQTRPDIGLNVVKVVVPGLRHFWKRWGKGRLYDVPVQLGQLTEPCGEQELNPFPIFL